MCRSFRLQSTRLVRFAHDVAANRSAPEEPFEIGPAPVPLRVIVSLHHERHARLFHPPRAWPNRFECKAVVHVEVEVAARAQGASNSTSDQCQVTLSLQMIER